MSGNKDNKNHANKIVFGSKIGVPPFFLNFVVQRDPAMKKEWLYGKTLEELEQIVADFGQKKFAAKQLCDWLYKKEAAAIDQMSNLPKSFREQLSEKYCVGESPVAKVDESCDGTKKYLYCVADNVFVEAAYIPDNDRATLCVSSQGGCRMGCRFCMTGRQRLQHQLSAGEILNQIKSLPEKAKLTNVVYMGMGEPLDNADNVLKSIEILTASWGYGWSPTRITLSTIGLIPKMKRFIEQSKANLTVSLHCADPAKREQLMPIQKRYSIETIVSEIRKYDISGQRRVSFGYIMFDGVNDTKEDADKIARLLKGVNCRINLIHYHRIPDCELKPSSHEKILRFRDYLNSKGFLVTIRASRGEDIFAACGMLSTQSQTKQ